MLDIRVLCHLLPCRVIPFFCAETNIPCNASISQHADAYPSFFPIPKITRSLRNWRLEQPYSHAAYEHAYAVEATLWRHNEKSAVIDGITPNHLQAFIPRLLQQLQVEIFVHGNVVCTTHITLSFHIFGMCCDVMSLSYLS